jgi:broad specificity phosphatase PhoE
MVAMESDDSTVAGAELWLVRHGETEWSRDHRHTSRTDLPLLATGEAAARELAPRLSAVGFGLVLTSPMRRARDTATLAGFADAEVTQDAVEWDYGEYEGITTAQIRETVPGWSVWRHGAPGGELAGEVAGRVDRVIDRVRASGVERALLFAHGHLLRVLAARWLEQAPEEGSRYRLDTATVSVLGWERDTRVILRWNG